MKKSFISPLCRIKAEKVVSACSNWLQGKVVDVGAGRCYIAQKIQQDLGHQVYPVDIDDLNETDMKLKIYNGRNLPFKKHSFDTALLVYVLHHCESPEDTLKECRRVAKKRVIIFEDFGPVALTHIFDYIANKILHKVESPLNFRSEDEWVKTFTRLGFKIVHVKHGVEKEWFYPFVSHTMFVLEKSR